jgi:cell wall assembly regulator SMI1
VTEFDGFNNPREKERIMFSGTSKELLMEDIQEIESKLKLTLPEQLVKHYLEFNGGIPDKSDFYSEEADMETSISTFLPMMYDDGINSTLEENYLYFQEREIVPENLMPFAIDWGGNQFCIDLENGQVFIVWLDLGEVNEDAIRFIANDFDEFINGLESEDD